MATSTKQAISDSERRWRVEHRNEIQSVLFELYEGEQARISKGKDIPAQQDRLESIIGLLVGAAFALWRAVFLATEAPRNREEVREMSIQVLEKLVDDNAFLFGDERRWERWSSGFYLNSAGFHLEEARKRAVDAGLILDQAIVDEFLDARKGGIGTPPAESWEKACAMLKELAKATRPSS